MDHKINDGSVWRAFEDWELTHSAAHYLMAIMHLREEYGYARVTDVATYLKVSRGAASRAISLLKERGWLDEDPHRMLLMTEAGLEKARSVERNFLVAEQFFEGVLGLDEEHAREDACKLEHLLSPRTSEAMMRFLKVLHDHPKIKKTIQDHMDDVTICENKDGECPICGSQESCIAEGTDLNGTPEPEST